MNLRKPLMLPIHDTLKKISLSGVVLTLLWIILLSSTIYFRWSGLYEGIEKGYVRHPDTPKQVLALRKFLSGRYQFNTGSLFYDGYPYGLNRIDELLIRTARILPPVDNHLRGVRHKFNLTLTVARTLRFIYSLVLLFLAGCLAYFLIGRKSVLPAVILFGLSPVSIDVSHYASGDIGVDLFTAFMLLGLVGWVLRERQWYLLCASLALGIAFSCKYNGMLAAYVPGLMILTLAIRKRSWSFFFISALVSLVGILIGILLATPAYFVDWHKQLIDTWNNFRFISNYKVPEEILNKPFIHKAFLGLTKNTPEIMAALGWPLIIFSFGGTLVAILQKWGSKPNVTEQDREKRIIDIRWIIFSFPFFAIIISLAGKFNVQPFHFSYIVLPLYISLIFLLYNLYKKNISYLKKTAVLLYIIVAFTSFQTDIKNDFFWRHDDNKLLYNIYTNYIEKPSVHDISCCYIDNQCKKKQYNTIRTIFLEGKNTAVFRNLFKTITMDHAEFWRKIRTPPIPLVPMQMDTDWIFVNGPLLPIDDRQFLIHAGSHSVQTKKYFIYYDEIPENIRIGLRAGSYPVHTVINVGGDKKEIHIPRQSQQIVTFQPKPKQRVIEIESRTVIYIPCSIALDSDDLWLTVLADASEEYRYRFFGSENIDANNFNFDKATLSYLEKELSLFYYLKGRSYLVLDANDSGNRQHAFIGTALEAGNYDLALQVQGVGNGGRLKLWIDDARGDGGFAQAYRELPFTGGKQILHYHFKKRFAPYQCRFVAEAVEGKLQVVSWKLLPDIQ